ncbi:hypothetical protein ACIHCQ_16865 [Streptomyces sp. NPDC052236]|uniref:hypothetical protein n=1 Tax=Streptomyces sp. NPDC052236 TaxID=3365686 RepID=UPI0037D358CE
MAAASAAVAPRRRGRAGGQVSGEQSCRHRTAQGVGADVRPAHGCRPGGAEACAALSVQGLRHSGQRAVGDHGGGGGRADWTVPADTANCRLDATFSRNLQWHGLRSHRVEASWTFRSGHTDATTPLPLTVVRFQPPTDPHGVAHADTRFRVPFVIQQQGFPSHWDLRAVTGVAPYDDGATWTRVPATTSGGRGTAWLTHPPASTARWVTLRAGGEDTAGNTFNQTVIQAYRLG